MYIVLIMQNETTPAVYTFATENEALAYYHNELAYRHESRTSTKCAILDSTFQVLRCEEYRAPQIGPNEEPQEG